MDQSQVLQSFKEIDEEIDLNGNEYSAQTHVRGMNHSYYSLFGYDDNQRLLVITDDPKATLKSALENGRQVNLTEGYRPNDAYDRTVLIERVLRSGHSLDEAIARTEGKPDYKALDKELGEPVSGQGSAAPGMKPSLHPH